MVEGPPGGNWSLFHWREEAWWEQHPSAEEKTLDDFRSGWELNFTNHLTWFDLICGRCVTVLFCTEVAAMGVHCPDLCLGVSLGRDKYSGRPYFSPYYRPIIDFLILYRLILSSCQKLPKVAKSCQKLPKVVKRRQKLPKAAKRCQK